MLKVFLVSANSDEGVLLVLVESDQVKLTELSSTANSPLFKVDLESVRVDRESIIHEKGKRSRGFKIPHSNKHGNEKLYSH